HSVLYTLSLHAALPICGPGEITISFADDLVVLADALVYPDPSKPATEQTTRVRYEINNKLFEDAIRDLVDVSIGPNALPARQHRSEEHTSELQSRENLV